MGRVVTIHQIMKKKKEVTMGKEKGGSDTEDKSKLDSSSDNEAKK